MLAAGFAALGADLVALQETVVDDGSPDHVGELLGDGYEVVHQGQRAADGTGCSIASRWAPVRTIEVDGVVSGRVDPDDFVGRSTIVEVATSIGPVLFVNHKPSWRLPLERERELQAVRVATAIEELVDGRPDAHVVVAGDFDARPETASMRFWTGRQSLEGASVAYLDAWEAVHGDAPGHTFTPADPLVVVESDWSRIPPRRIDQLLVRCDDRGPTLRVVGCERLFDAPVDGVWASDHFGVVADLVP